MYIQVSIENPTIHQHILSAEALRADLEKLQAFLSLSLSLSLSSTLSRSLSLARSLSLSLRALSLSLSVCMLTYADVC